MFDDYYHYWWVELFLLLDRVVIVVAVRRNDFFLLMVPFAMASLISSRVRPFVSGRRNENPNPISMNPAKMRIINGRPLLLEP